MTFLWPYMLWLMSALPILVGLYILLVKRRSAEAKQAGRFAPVQRALAQQRGFRRHLPPALLLLSLAIMLFAVSRPAAVVTLPSQTGTVVLTMDNSLSMRADDVEPTRMVASQRAAGAFIEEQPPDVRIGVVTFADGAFVVQIPTRDRAAVSLAIESIRMEIGTAVGSGIISGLAAVFGGLPVSIELTPSGRSSFLGEIENVDAPELQPVARGMRRSAALVLLTDGQTTHGPDPVQAAQIAADLGVRVYTIGLGTEEGVVLGFGGGGGFRAILDEESLIAIAETTGAEYYRANSSSDLTRIYDSITSELVFTTEEREITSLVTALAGLMALFGAAMSVSRFGKIA